MLAIEARSRWCTSVMDEGAPIPASDTHLAGALGKPVWILLTYVSDWRWLLDREGSPWYPSARLFRQQVPNDWKRVVSEPRQALAKHGIFL